MWLPYPQKTRRELFGRIRVCKVQTSSTKNHEPDEGRRRSPPQHLGERSTIWIAEFCSETGFVCDVVNSIGEAHEERPTKQSDGNSEEYGKNGHNL